MPMEAVDEWTFSCLRAKGDRKKFGRAKTDDGEATFFNSVFEKKFEGLKEQLSTPDKDWLSFFNDKKFDAERTIATEEHVSSSTGDVVGKRMAVIYVIEISQSDDADEKMLYDFVEEKMLR